MSYMFKNILFNDVTKDRRLEAVIHQNPCRVREILSMNRMYLDCSNPEEGDKTALCLAASLGSLDIVRILIEEGHECMGYTHSFDNMPMEIAARNKHYDIVEYFAELRQKRKLLMDGVQQKNSSLVRSLIKSNKSLVGFRYNGDSELGGTILHLAASVGSLEIVEILIEEGRASMGYMNKFGEFPRHVAARNKHYDIVKYMAKLRQNRGLLHDAVEEKNSSLVRSLIKFDKSLVSYRFSDIELEPTILHVACEVRSLEIVKILVEEGHADFHQGDMNEELPKELAARNGHFDIVHYLTQAGCTCDVDFFMNWVKARQAKQMEQAKQVTDKHE